ncbi:unnamed protein product, partial [Oikopleura dioica]
SLLRRQRGDCKLLSCTIEFITSSQEFGFFGAVTTALEMTVTDIIKHRFSA